MADTNWQNRYLRIAQAAGLKHLESPFLYHVARDDLYEIDEKALRFLAQCDGSHPVRELTQEFEFVQYCLEEGLLELSDQAGLIPVAVPRSPVPSLRYLELQLTHRCNLKCRHCYLGPPGESVLALEDSLAIIETFAAHGGLRLLLSGGEPLLYPELKELIAATEGMKMHRVLLTNGTRINSENIYYLNVENIQFSLDGWQAGHELVRGPGTFLQALAGIDAARSAGIPVSIATMIHEGNLEEFDRLQSFVEEIEATEWGIDVLGLAGSLVMNKDLLVTSEKAAPLMTYAFGGGYHGPSDGYGCGRHLVTVMPSGEVVKCGFYHESPLGNAAQEGLMNCWQRLIHIPLEQLECQGCPALEECAGGCRFRASNPLGPDPVMCALYRYSGVDLKQGQ